MWKLKKLLPIFIAVLMVVLVLAIKNEPIPFTNGKYSENLTYNYSILNQTRYVNIWRNSYINNFTFLLSGLDYYGNGSNQITQFQDHGNFEYLNLTAFTNITRTTIFPKFSYVENITLTLDIPTLDTISWYKLDHNTTFSNNLTAYDSVGSNDGTLNGYSFSHGKQNFNIRYTYKQDAETSYSCSGSFSLPCSNAVDEDISTRATPSLPNGIITVYENTTIPANFDTATWYGLFQTVNAQYINISCLNYGTNNYDLLQSLLTSISVPPVLLGNNIPNNCINGNNISIKTTLTSASSAPGYYEGWVNFTTLNNTNRTNTTYGKYGKGAGFDGDGDYINISPIMYKPTSFTFSFWIKSDIWGDNNEYILFSSRADNTNYTEITKRTDNKIGLVFQNVANVIISDSIASWNKNNWHHVAVVYGDENAIYLDGINSTSLFSYQSPRVFSDILIGTRYSMIKYFNGSIDSVLIYNRSLSASEIRSIYNNQTKYTPIGQGLIAQYAFENNNATHTFDENNLVVGKYEEAMNFDGKNDYIDMGTPSDFNLTNPFTLSTWIYKIGNEATQRIISKDQQYMIRITGSDDITYNVWNEGGPNIWVNVQKSNINNNEWMHLVEVWNGTHVIGYYNGELVGSQSGTYDPDTDYSDLRIGSGTSVQYFNGSIDDVLIFNTSLTSSQIRYLYDHQIDKYYPENLKIYANEKLAYQSIFHGKRNASLNLTPINDYLENEEACCNFTFSSDNTSYLYYEIYNISYIGHYPKNIYAYIGNEQVYNHTAEFREQNLQFIVDNPYSLVQNCNCTNCSIVGDYCKVPFQFYSEYAGRLNINNLTPTYSKQFFLIDEVDNTLFNLDNITGARLYYDNNNSFYDFKALDNNNANITLEDNKLRLQLTYADGSIITRYVDTDLLDKDIRLCANKEGTTHYEQLILSNAESPVRLHSVFANCEVAADYTRFAYQNAYLLKAYTIDTQYNLYTFPSGIETILVGVDGSVASYMNIDTIEFSKNSYDVDILGSLLSIDEAAANTTRIYYKNDDAPNTALSIEIKSLDDNTVYYSEDTFDDLDEQLILFNYATLDVNETTIFLITVESTNAEGTTTTKRYFNTNHSAGLIGSAIAFVVAFFISIFTITFSSVKTTFGIFGILGQIISIIILSFAIAVWYIYFMMALNIIAIVYIILIMGKQSGSGVLG